MIRLTFVSTLAYNYFFPGKVKQAGGHTRIYNLAKAFARRPGYEVFCMTGDFGQPDFLVKDNVTLVKAPIDNPFALVRVAEILAGIKPDLLLDFCASPRLFLYFVLRQVTGIKYVFFTGSDNDVNGGYRQVENGVYDFFYRQGLKYADSIIAQVPEHAKLLQKNWRLNAHLILSPYLNIQYKKRGKKDIVLWVGRAAFYKRPELFVALANAHPEQLFVMICNKSGYDNGFMDDLDTVLAKTSNLEFHEYVPYPRMAQFYNRAKLLVNTSDFEGFSNTFIEAAVHFTPVLSLNSDPNHMLSIHRGGHCCRGDFEQMRYKMEKLLQDETRLAEYGRHIFNYAYQFHRIETAVAQLDTIFQKLV